MELRETIEGTRLVAFLQSVRQRNEERPVAFLCIGTDRSTGDALGPLVGTGLRAAGFGLVYGTLEKPCDAHTLPSVMEALEREKALRPDMLVIAVDAALGRAESVGKFQVTNEPMLPGLSLQRDLPAVGDYGVAGIVNVTGPRPYAALQNTSLFRVMTMADTIVAAIRTTW